MKILTLSILLFVSMCCCSQSLKGMIDSAISNKPQSIQDAYYQKAKWNDSLAEYLIENNQADISLTGYQFLMLTYVNPFVYSSLEDKWSKQDIVDDINQMVELNQLSSFGLSLALGVCQEYFEKTKTHCDMKQITNKQKALEPNNAYVYLYPIKKAVENKDNQKIKQLLKQMAQTKHLEIFNYTHKMLDSIIDDFYQTNPFQAAYIEFKKEQLINETKMDDEKQRIILEKLEEYLLLEEKIDFQLAIPIPAFKPLVDLCKNNNQYQKECLRISDIFIPNKNIIPAMIGHAIKTEILKKIDHEKFLAAKAAQQKYRAVYDCLSEISQKSNFWLHFDFDVYEIASQEQRLNGTLALLKKQTELYYQREIKQGYTELNNPKECFVE